MWRISTVLLIIASLFVSACGGTYVDVEVTSVAKPIPGFYTDDQKHRVAQRVGVIHRARWGYQGERSGYISNKMSHHLGTTMWCFKERIQGVLVAKCTTKRHMDSVLPNQRVSFQYNYYPNARWLGIAAPVFLDTCYRCGSYRRYPSRHTYPQQRPRVIKKTTTTTTTTTRRW